MDSTQQTQDLAGTSRAGKKCALSVKSAPGKLLPEMRAEIERKLRAGVPKSRIAKDLGISRPTVYRAAKDLPLVLQSQATNSKWTAIVERIAHLAFIAVERAIVKGDGLLAMRFLERTILAEGLPRINVMGDATIQTLIQLAPAVPPSPEPSPVARLGCGDESGPDADARRDTAKEPTEAGAKAPQGDLTLHPPTQFSAPGVIQEVTNDEK